MMDTHRRISLASGSIAVGLLFLTWTIDSAEPPPTSEAKTAATANRDRTDLEKSDNPLTKLKSQLKQGGGRVINPKPQLEVDGLPRGPAEVKVGGHYTFEVDLKNTASDRDGTAWVEAGIVLGEGTIEGENPRSVTVPAGKKVTLRWSFVPTRLDNDRLQYAARVLAGDSASAQDVKLKLKKGGAADKQIGGDTAFLAQAKRVADKFEINVGDLLGLIASESGFSPDSDNGTHVGLIQFSADAAKAVGATQAELKKLTRAEQMKYVEKYLDYWKLPQGANAGQIYVAVFAPAYASKSGSDTLYSKPSRAYKSNEPLDKDKDGNITVSEMGERIQAKKKEWGITD